MLLIFAAAEEKVSIPTGHTVEPFRRDYGDHYTCQWTPKFTQLGDTQFYAPPSSGGSGLTSFSGG